MKFYELREATGIESLRKTEGPVPRPGPGQCLVRVHAVSLNYRDLAIVTGNYARQVKKPLIPLSDGAGEVVETGLGVTRFRTGDRVAGIFFQAWIAGATTPAYWSTALGGAVDGMLSEYVVLDQQGLVGVPNHLGYEQAATLPCAAVTAWNALTSASIAPGQTVLILGTGGVSIFALQLARLAGARVIVTSKSDEKLERARQLGASAGINYTRFAAWGDKVLEITGDGVDHVIEVGGPGTIARSFNATRVGGRVSVIGMLAGVNQEINPLIILGKQLTVQGVFVGSREHFETMNRAISFHGLEPVVDRVFGFDEVHDAMRWMAAGSHFGKVVVRLV